MAAGLNDLGWDVEVWPWGHRSDTESILEKLIGRFLDARALSRSLLVHRPDFLVINTGLDWRSVIRDVVLTQNMRDAVPLSILQPHGSQSQRLVEPGHWLFKRLVRMLLRAVDAVFVLSTEELGHLSAFSPRTPAYVVQNPFDPDCLASVSPTQEKSGFTALFVGRLVRSKGIFDLISAAADVDGDGILDVLLVGDGPDRKEAERMVARLDLQDHVRFRGHCDGQALSSCYTSADVLVLPSYSEGFPTVVAEAMAFGLPIACTELRGVVDYLGGEDNALFFPAGNVEELRASILRLRDDPSLRRRMRENNHELVKRFHPTLVAANYRSLIERLLLKKEESAL